LRIAFGNAMTPEDSIVLIINERSDQKFRRVLYQN
jgi:hypothetical protein